MTVFTTSGALTGFPVVKTAFFLCLYPALCGVLPPLVVCKCKHSVTFLNLKLGVSRFYLLLAALPVLLSVLGFPQQVGEGQRLQGARAGGSGIPERVGVPRVPPAPDRAERPWAHAAWRVDAVDANHGGFFRVQSSERLISVRFRFTRVRLDLRVSVLKNSDPGNEEEESLLTGRRPQENQDELWFERERWGAQRRGRPLDDLRIIQNSSWNSAGVSQTCHRSDSTLTTSSAKKENLFPANGEHGSRF